MILNEYNLYKKDVARHIYKSNTIFKKELKSRGLYFLNPLEIDNKMEKKYIFFRYSSNYCGTCMNDIMVSFIQQKKECEDKMMFFVLTDFPDSKIASDFANKYDIPVNDIVNLRSISLDTIISDLPYVFTLNNNKIEELIIPSKSNPEKMEIFLSEFK